MHADTREVDNIISDHKAALAFINFTNIIKSCSKRKIWNYTRADFAKGNNLIGNANWGFHQCPRYKYGMWKIYETLLDFMGQCMPLKDIIVLLNDRLWYNSEIRQKIQNSR